MQWMLNLTRYCLFFSRDIVTIIMVFQAIIIFLVLSTLYINFHATLCSSYPIYIFYIMLVCILVYCCALAVDLLMKIHAITYWPMKASTKR